MFSVQLIGCFTLIRKEIVRIFRIWSQTLLPSVITITLYFLIFGTFVGSRVGLVEGVPYISFIVPGLIMMAIINNSFANVAFAVFSNKFQRCIEELLVSPLYESSILIGYLSGGMVRGIVVGFLVTVISLLFSTLHFHSIAIVCLTVFLTSVFFALLGFINAMIAKSFDDVSMIPTFVLTPLTYLGGIFYSIKALPPFWQKVSLLNPILYIVNIFRYGFLGKSDIPIGMAIPILILMTVVLWFVCLGMLKRGVGLRN